jgi:hypothetical protein
MIKLLIKLAIAALIAHAAWRGAIAYSHFYKFKDAVEQATQYGPEKSDAELHDRVLELAAQYDVPLEDDGFTIRHSQDHTMVDGSSDTELELIPGYKKVFPMAFHVDTFRLPGGAQQR